MVNFQKVNLPKCQLDKKVDSLKTPSRSFGQFYDRVDFLASGLFGNLTLWRLTISPSISSLHHSLNFRKKIFIEPVLPLIDGNQYDRQLLKKQRSSSS
jgi:hypothetical protein